MGEQVRFQVEYPGNLPDDIIQEVIGAYDEAFGSEELETYGKSFQAYGRRGGSNTIDDLIRDANSCIERVVGYPIPLIITVWWVDRAPVTTYHIKGDLRSYA